MQIARFRGGLKREIQDQMKMLNTFTLGQAFDLSRKAEEPIRAPPVRTRFTNQQFQTGPSKVTIPNEPATETANNENRPRRATPQQAPNLYAKPMPSLCYRCHQPGHRSNQCPQRPTVNFVEGDYIEEEDDCHETEVVDRIEEDGDDDFIGMITRQLCEFRTKKAEEVGHDNLAECDNQERKLNCIVQRIFLTPKRGPEISTRHQVFRTNALINGVIAKVVIDTGSS
ncbi:hypothetical protein LWI29_003799 [Acer saccharum]|uniref:CCHC-type domain-containing protein n=1 Tax=Acer saccharum TaxID=4024 RepID=A0AA39VRW1_ACESA|nr:hypothetical protein LWI29_003799 [Acer saccharum]